MAEALIVQGEEPKDPRYIADPLAISIADKWQAWHSAKSTWEQEKSELRAYIFATDTKKTSNGNLPWKNSTVTPKLTQLRDNLHANYMAALMPNDDWFIWESNDKDSASMKKKEAILAYMRTKTKASDLDLTISQAVLDYIDYGNVFVGHEYVNLTKQDPNTGEDITMYRGPRAYRISPLDVVFDPTAPTFDRSPLIVRTLKSIADIRKDELTKPQLGYDPEVLQKVYECRNPSATDTIEQIKSDGISVDGFGTIQQYLQSGMVEILEFYGDYYEQGEQELYQDFLCAIVDRRWILKKQVNPSWLGKRPIFHCGWRVRPDNLWAQGPLDQLVGMQYRIDHLENLKADVFDQIAHPVVVVMGDTVEDFKFGPGEQIHCGAEGKVEFARPDATALNADMQIADLMNKMEELAGAPRQAMGIRTPGEKTKYEVQVLENGAGRIFQAKASWFERKIIEPLLNSMLEESVRTMTTADTVKTTGSLGEQIFMSVTKEDLNGNGKLYPIGARHFAEQAKFVQELTTTMQLIEQMPTVKPHISGKNLAAALNDALGWSRYNIVQDNIAVSEQAETQRLINTAQESINTEQGIPSELQSTDMVQPNANQQPTTSPQA